MAGQTKRTEFSQALKAVVSERGLDVNTILDAIKQAIVAAYKKDAKEQGNEEVEEQEYEAQLDPVTGGASVWFIDPDDPDNKKDVTPPGFGRIAAQTAKQVIHQKIREAEKGAIMSEFTDRVGNLISGIVLRFDGPDVRIDLGRTEGIMPASERVPNERLNPGQRLTFLLKEIQDTPRGKQLILSRAGNEFVEKIFAREVPEINSKSVQIKKIAREPGVRTKIAVFSDQPGVDPVGSCVGQKGVRVQSVTNELGGERIDIIPWSNNEEEFIKATLSPVEVVGIDFTDKENREAKVTVVEAQLSMAIGTNGQNIRLASKLTGWTLEVDGDGSPVEEIEKVKEEVKEEETKAQETDQDQQE